MVLLWKQLYMFITLQIFEMKVKNLIPMILLAVVGMSVSWLTVLQVTKYLKADHQSGALLTLVAGGALVGVIVDMILSIYKPSK